MQVTVHLPDEIAAQARAEGKSPEDYLQAWINAGIPARPAVGSGLTAEELEIFLRNMASYSDEIPALPDEALTRASIYSDHD